ncbi:hypothetical protein C1H46_000312 [Malus baccata]|uniref:Pectinesterase inhibitor domain-containing protein n=1 Tax=Malus baccata TaxID=106549 RepID=A0A540NSJ7_MALBA|nr:hypothetical protein C1H46_000312 [Malus baccata]
MARLGDIFLSFLVFFFNVCSIGTAYSAGAAIARHSRSTDFIKASCRTTQYPALCVQSLAAYASAIRQSERQLAQTALTVSLARVRSAASFVTKLTRVRGIKPREYRAVKDCIENMGDSVDRLGQSVQELGRMGRAFGQDFMWHMSNVETWVSAALTDEGTCLDGFSGRFMDGNIKNAIRRRVNNVAHLIRLNQKGATERAREPARLTGLNGNSKRGKITDRHKQELHQPILPSTKSYNGGHGRPSLSLIANKK